MTGYVFWCSKCKIDHAGECPPPAEASGKALAAWVEATDELGPLFYLCPICLHVYQTGDEAWACNDSHGKASVGFPGLSAWLPNTP